MTEKAHRVWFVLVSLFGFGFYFISGKRLRAQEWLFERLFTLGGVYVKFLQLLALREDSLSMRFEHLRDVLAVFDQATYENIDLPGLLRMELGEHANRLQLHSLAPFAAGSFAQVYSASLDNQEVVIKVLRPSVVRQLRFDLSLLGFAMKVISWFQTQGLIDLNSIFEEFKRVTLQEIDYQKEAKTAQALAEKLFDNPVIHIPKTYLEFSTRHIIVQEKINGLPLTRLMASDIPNKVQYTQETLGTDLNFVLGELADELIMGTLSHGGTHGDPHPGNIYVLHNNKIALIDFGIEVAVKENQPALIGLLSEYASLHRGEFNAERFSQALIAYFVPELTQSIQTLSAYLGKQDLVASILKELGATAAQTLSEKSQDAAVSTMLQQQRIMHIFIRVINKGNRFGLRANIETPAFLRSTQIFFMIVHLLDCDRQLLRKAFERAVTTHRNLQETGGPQYDIHSIDKSMLTVANWFERLQYSDPSLYTRIIRTWERA